MHTVKVVGTGMALLVACALIGRSLQGDRGVARASLAFVPLWLVGSGVNMYIGVHSAGYTAKEELPVAVGVFSAPAAVALGLWWTLSR